jgi:hypothetical protein
VLSAQSTWREVWTIQMRITSIDHCEYTSVTILAKLVMKMPIFDVEQPGVHTKKTIYYIVKEKII